MSDDSTRNNGLTIGLWIAAGALSATALGLVIARNAARRTHVEIAETVEQLRDRTEKALQALADDVQEALGQSRREMDAALGNDQTFLREGQEGIVS